MKTSIDLPDDLYRRVKARSAMEGRAVREVATELLAAWVNTAPAKQANDLATSRADGQWLYEWSALGARVSRAKLKASPSEAKRTKSSAGKAPVKQRQSGKKSANDSLVDQLSRDRR